MSQTYADKLQDVKSRKWFYEFELPDGSRTATDIPDEILPIHTSRRDKMVEVIRERVKSSQDMTAADLASHEGYYTIELAKHFKTVRGYEFRQTSLEASRLIRDVIQADNVDYVHADLQKIVYDESMSVDFVLLYGLIYHLENPIHTIRLASQMCRRHMLIETQIFPYDISGGLEDGHYTNIRPIEGVFGLTPDYAHGRKGGSTDIALVPSLNSLLFLLKTFGFAETVVLPSHPLDYEQFRRHKRVIVYARKAVSDDDPARIG